MDKKQKTPLLLESKQGFKKSKKPKDISDDITLSVQRQRLLAWLREKKPITTIQARAELNILAPAARIWELRHNEGYNIVTNFVEDITTEGKPHRVAQYALLSGKFPVPTQTGKAQPVWRQINVIS
ncbi:hypothetical protein GAMM_40022 [Gammaproteobacteria bacterium]